MEAIYPHIMKITKYLFEFIAIFVAISLSFLVEDWREERQNRNETKKALEFIKMDMRIDTNYFKLRLSRLERHANALGKGLDGEIPADSMTQIKSLLQGLRGNADYHVQQHGIYYLRNNIKMPDLKNDTLLVGIGMYYQLASPQGNYGLFNSEHFQLASQNYYQLFEVFPGYLDADTSVVHDTIQKGMNEFFSDPFWYGRIHLMYREANRSMPLVYRKQRDFAEHLLQKIDQELDDNIEMYTMKN